MDKRPIALLIALTAPACAADGEVAVGAGLPGVAATVAALSPGANYVAGFDVRQLQRDPALRAALAAERGIGWFPWAAEAALLQLDPFADASDVAVAASIGSCGVTDSFVLVVPTGAAGDVAARAADAIGAWRRQHPRPPDDAGEPADPARSRWVAVPDGSCTIVQVGDYDELGVTVRPDGSLFLHGTPFGDACRPASERDLPPEVTEATWLAGAALAQSWQVGAGGDTPAVIEAMPGGAEVTWLGDRSAGSSP